MKIASNGIQIHVKDQGNGTLPVVFLHYWGGSSRTWDDVIAALPAEYRTIAPDLRGWGDSDAPSAGYALADFADDAQHMIAAMNLQRFILVGHSMGGKIAQLLASRRPQGLAGLVLVAPSPPVPLALPAEVRASMEGAYLSRESVGMAIDQMLTAKPLSPKHREQVIEDSLRGAPQAKLAWPRSTSQEDITLDVAAIDVPTIVIAGELDRIDGTAILEAELLTRIPHAVMRVLPGTGHLSPLESPVGVAGIIREFVDKLERASGDAITVTLLMKVKDDHAADFIGGLPELMRETSSAPGVRSVRAFHNVETVNAILFVEEWENEAAFKTYIAWRTERGDMARLGQMLSKPPEISTWSAATRAVS
ncbi:2-succinyl-6-hydroxy-2,4-cyclohexadiene-1-carboxylate synthase (plasmid) [Caballeronia sp. SBC1]|uniref:alpha/beta fold hydrolase n=1 Tax=unclassified Caballeronia TaxID=2646786 RepID=UPI0013E1290C|nr:MULTISPECIES: alpha/beta fold hydrolase [unclassified Caballeronia]QIE26226.1 2-succinyl-6-hydroxy-2,4-cyclohexadiene-1-carboxylate synthase [Caballeronia sp. SBC2]QIN64461.1 2-succinyl-6-hydroxy-2,4-cyclohexadiene-1-carboxylate synthase [Caballeronia sp. SBC1]